MINEVDFALLRLPAGKQPLKEKVIDILPIRDNKIRQITANQFAALNAKHLGEGEICFKNARFSIEHQQTQRRKVKQVTVLVQFVFKLQLSREECSVLDLQFMDKLLCILQQGILRPNSLILRRMFSTLA